MILAAGGAVIEAAQQQALWMLFLLGVVMSGATVVCAYIYFAKGQKPGAAIATVVGLVVMAIVGVAFNNVMNM